MTCMTLMYEILMQFWEAISFVNEELHSYDNNITISSFHFKAWTRARISLVDEYQNCHGHLHVHVL